MKVFIIAALVLVAQCQLHPAQRGQEGQRTEEAKKPEVAQKTLQMPVFPEEMKSLKLRFYDDYDKAILQRGGRRDDSLKATLIAAIRNEAYEQLLQKGTPNPMEDPKNNDLLVELYSSQSSKDAFNKDDPQLITEQGVVVRNFLAKEIKIRKDARSGRYIINDIGAVLQNMEGENLPTLFIVDDFSPEMRQKITDLVQQRQGRTEETRIEGQAHAEGQAGHGADAGGRGVTT